jgi:hypothetical protein
MSESETVKIPDLKTILLRNFSFQNSVGTICVLPYNFEQFVEWKYEEELIVYN